MTEIAAAIHPAVSAMTVTAHQVSSAVSIPIGLEMFAVIIASVTGALTAREKRLDLVGAIGLAVVCSLGGGLLRDMTLQVGNVYILNQPLALPASIITAAITFVFPRRIFDRQDKLISFLDIFAVGLYAAMGADKALVYGFEPLVGVMMGFFTAVGGGMLRDICLGQTPYIFQRSNFYALSAIAGSCTYVLLVTDADVPNLVALVVCVLVTMLSRYVSLHYDIKSPTDDDVHRTIHKAHHKVKTIVPSTVSHMPRSQRRSKKRHRRHRR